MKLKSIITFVLIANSFVASSKVLPFKRTFESLGIDCYQDTTLPYLMSLDLNYYRNKTVDSFLSVLPINYTNRKIHGMGNLKYATVLSIQYPNAIRVLVFVKDFTHMNPRSETLQWDINLFKQEKIDCIEIWQSSTFLTSLRCNQH